MIIRAGKNTCIIYPLASSLTAFAVLMTIFWTITLVDFQRSEEMNAFLLGGFGTLISFYVAMFFCVISNDKMYTVRLLFPQSQVSLNNPKIFTPRDKGGRTISVTISDETASEITLSGSIYSQRDLSFVISSVASSPDKSEEDV